MSSRPGRSACSSTAPLGFGFDVSALAEQSLFISTTSGATPWMTAIRIAHSSYPPRPIASGEMHVVFRDLNGNARRDRGEAGVAGLVIRCNDRTLVTDNDGRFRCEADQAWTVDPASVPMGWVTPPIARDRRVLRDLGLIQMKAIEVHVDLADVDTIRVPRSELVKLIVSARDRPDILGSRGICQDRASCSTPCRPDGTSLLLTRLESTNHFACEARRSFLSQKRARLT